LLLPKSEKKNLSRLTNIVLVTQGKFAPKSWILRKSRCEEANMRANLPFEGTFAQTQICRKPKYQK
jgi:hypothetical protein